MRVLLDTHTFLWHLWNRPERSESCRSMIADLGNELLLSTASCWEMAIKQSTGKLGIDMPFDLFLESALHDNDLTLLPIASGHLGLVAALPFHHRDPFDRLLVAQALFEQVPLLSR